MFNRTIDKLKGYAMGTGANPLYQNIADYGSAAALGIVGQQGANWLMGGADPNPLLSGLLAAPLVTALGRGSRFTAETLRNPQQTSASARNEALIARQIGNPYERAALAGSIIGGLSGSATSLYNTVAGGTDYDNNLVSGGTGILAAAAPLTAYLLSRRKTNQAIPVV